MLKCTSWKTGGACKVDDICLIRNTVLYRQGGPNDQAHATHYHRLPYHIIIVIVVLTHLTLNEG
jgi:hypothetical protein